MFDTIIHRPITISKSHRFRIFKKTKYYVFTTSWNCQNIRSAIAPEYAKAI